jgi:cobalt-zinc-cadmium efflux system outer membrane protein
MGTLPFGSHLHSPAVRFRGAALLCVCFLGGCAQLPPRAPIDPDKSAADFAARRLDGTVAPLPAGGSAWDRDAWFRAALMFNPQLAEARSKALAVAAGERTAAERPNPTLNLFGEYVNAAAGSAAWLYGVSMEFLLPRKGERARAIASASLETEAAKADVAEAIWQVRSKVHAALLDAAYAHDEAVLLTKLVADSQTLVASNRALAAAGEIGASETLTPDLELARARQRLARAQALGSDAEARLAAAVGVSDAALSGVSLQWEGWADIAPLAPQDASRWRQAALIGRPQLVRALREYDLTDIALQTEVAKRWPQLHVSPGYAWDHSGLRQDTLDDTLHDTLHDNELGMTFELPIFNRHEGPIGEALARRSYAGRRIESVQAELLEEIERAERAWPQSQQAWRDAQASEALNARQHAAQERAFKAGATDRPTLIAGSLAMTEAALATLEAAYDARLAFTALESAYRRPLQGAQIPLTASRTSAVGS